MLGRRRRRTRALLTRRPTSAGATRAHPDPAGVNPAGTAHSSADLVGNVKAGPERPALLRDDDPYPNPGLPPPARRVTDTDPAAVARAAHQITALFTLSALASVGFIVAYVAFSPLDVIHLGVETASTSNLLLGLTLGVAMLAIGFAAIHWARRLMPDVELTAPRHLLRSPPETRAEALEEFQIGVDESGIDRRSVIRRSLLAAFAVLPLPAVVLLRDLGPLPGEDDAGTGWDAGVRVVSDPELVPVRAADLVIGSLVNALPATFADLPTAGPARQNALARDAVIVVRISPDDIDAPPGRGNWGVGGILAYSKICTHLGCPVNLYEDSTHHLLCPCHQSTFQLNRGGAVIFGPAARSLPQLALDVDSEGYLVAKLPGGFQEPVGPSSFYRDGGST